MYLKNKRILITAGPTWVPIDSVRVISNIATGKTGVLLAERMQNLGAKVTLVLGPGGACCLNRKIKVIRFQFFDELKRIIINELRTKRYHVLIHSAAVSDYRPKEKHNYKISSNLRQWRLNLVPTPKIIDLIKRINTYLYLVGFKFEPGASSPVLLTKARVLLKRAKADCVVANTVNKRNRYLAYILNQKTIHGPISKREDLVKELIKIIGDDLCCN